MPPQANLVDTSAVELFERSATAFPEHIAVRAGDRELSYRELNRRANQVAHAILANHPGNAPIPFVLGYDTLTVIAILGIIKTGCPFVALDPSNPSERNRLILSTLDARLLITDRVHRSRADASMPPGQKPLVLDLDDLSSDLDVENPGIVIPPQALIYIMFTSGSTGTPKGVMCSHQLAIHYSLVMAKKQNLSPEDRLCLFSPFTFVFASIELIRTFYCGAAACLYDVKTGGLVGMAEWLEAEGITVFPSTPSAFRAIFEQLPQDMLFKQLRLIYLGGEVITAADLALFRAHTRPSCTLETVLSSTETSNITSFSVDHSMPVNDQTGSYGYLIPDKDISLLDDDRRQVAAGEIGEIAVKSKYLFSGYWRQPELTAKKLQTDPENPQIHTFFTGDLGRFLPDGALQYLGRKDEMVKIQGQRIEIAEVKAALARHPAVMDSIVTARTSPHGNGEKWLVAYFVPRPGMDPGEIELRKFLSEILPAFMIPSRFISLKSLPLNPHGKVDVKTLPEPALEGEQIEPSLSGSEEEVLLHLWSRVFGRNELDIQGDFFDLGGNSLIAIRLLAGVEDQFGVRIPIPFLEKYRTIQQMAKYIRRKRFGETLPAEQGNLDRQADAPVTRDDSSLALGVVPIQPEGSKTPLFILSAGLYMRGFAFGFAPDRPIYGLHPIENGQITFHSSVQETARGYYRNLIEFRPHGPYLLLGHSALGYFALELARLLIQNGKNDVFVGLLDSYPPGSFPQARFQDRIRIHLDNLQGRNLRDVVEYFGRSAQSFSRRIFRRRARRVIARHGRAGDMNEVRLLTQMYYEPELIAFPVTLFAASVREWYVRWDPMENWNKVLTGSFNIIRVAGDHMSALEPPHVAEFVEKTRTRLAQFENTASGLRRQ